MEQPANVTMEDGRNDNWVIVIKKEGKDTLNCFVLVFNYVPCNPISRENNITEQFSSHRATNLASFNLKGR